MNKTSLDKAKIKFLLLEGVHYSAVETLERLGYSNIETHPKALPEEELKSAIADAHFIGIRSRTQLNAGVFDHAEKLVAAGCFCIGTNQVDLAAATERGIAVFNAPFSNTRSVAELVIAEAILLLRGVPEKNAAAHCGEWQKSANNSYEIRGKHLGIIGYGNIGMQLGVLAEALAEVLDKGHLSGAGIDVFPQEPRSTHDEFISPLRPFNNTFLTPHIGGSTMEAQENIGMEVAEKLARYSDNGTTISAVNFPEVALPEHAHCHRLLHLHRNIPGVMSSIIKGFLGKQYQHQWPVPADHSPDRLRCD